MRLKIISVLLSLILFGSVPKVSFAQQFDDMSIYHLPAKWETQDGTEINLSDLKGSVVVAVMIYTACKSACPILIGEMKNIEANVRQKTSGKVKYVLVSIDPSNDTPENLRKVKKAYGMTGDQWLFLRGTDETTREFANVLAVKYKQISPVDFSHSNIISVFDTGGKLVHQREGLNVDSGETIEKIVNLLSKK